MKTLIDIKQLNQKKLIKLLNKAQKIADNGDKKNRKILRGKTIANLFFENSTRTLISFELAAKKLGAYVINVNIAKSSTAKGETLKDTLQTLAAMSINAFVIRHAEAGVFEQIRQYLPNNFPLINAGDGNNQHPTQALLDVFTIRQHKGELKNLKIAIIGDIKHSRVANSLIDALHILDNRQIHLFGPKTLLPEQHNKAIICQSMDQALENANVIVMIRIQKERMQQHNIPNFDHYHENFGLNAFNIKKANDDCLVMHPGPINRGVEISSEVADNPHSLILKQVKNGVLVRQAVLATLLK